MNDWNFSIDEAPRGKTVETDQILVRSDKTIERKTEMFVPDWIWGASKCGKVIKTHWIPQEGKRAGRWLSFGIGEKPIAWQPFQVPVHPDLLDVEIVSA